MSDDNNDILQIARDNYAWFLGSLSFLLLLLKEPRTWLITWWRTPSERKMLAEAVQKLTTGLDVLTHTIEKRLGDLSDGLGRNADAIELADANIKIMMDSSPVGMWWCDPEGKCYRVNEALCQLFGLRPEEMTGAEGLGWMQVIIPEHRQRVYREFEASRKTGVPYECEYTIEPPTNRKWINVTARGEIIKGRGGKPLAIRGSVRPIETHHPVAA